MFMILWIATEYMKGGKAREKSSTIPDTMLIVELGIQKITHEAIGLRCKRLVGGVLWAIDFLSKDILHPLIVT